MFAKFCLILLLCAAAVLAVESPLACNLKALTPAERTRHAALGRKLSAAATAKHETADGLVFRLSLGEFSLAELGEWIDGERKCCPFLDFHFSLEREGRTVQLSLAGRAGVKEFLAAEFAKAGPHF